MTDPKETMVLEFKKNGPLLLLHFLIIGGVIAATCMHKLDIGVAVLILGALNVPGLVGVKTVPGLVAAIVAEVQKQLTPLNLPPPAAPAPPPTIPEPSAVVVEKTETTTSYAAPPKQDDSAP